MRNEAAPKSWSSNRQVALGLVLTSWSDQFINAHNKTTLKLSNVSDFIIRKHSRGTFFMDAIAFGVQFDSDLFNFCPDYFLAGSVARSSGGLLHWAAVKKHSWSQKLLN